MAPSVKRKLPKDSVQADIPKFYGSKASRFATCPVCSRSVPISLVNHHLDHDCTLVTAEEPQPTPVKEPPAVQPPPRVVPAPAADEAPLLQQQEQLAGVCIRHPDKAPLHTESEDEEGWALEVLAGGGGELQQQKAAGPAATAYRSGSKQGRGLGRDELFAAAYCELRPAFLPAELAQQLLQELMQDQPGWQRQQWWMPRGGSGHGYGQEVPQESSKTSCQYMLTEEPHTQQVGK